MSEQNERRNCPMKAQELRAVADYVVANEYWSPKLKELADWLEKPAAAEAEPTRAPSECIHARLQLQLVVPEECLVRGDIGAWYACLQCGQHFRSDIQPYKLKVTTAPEYKSPGDRQRFGE